ncbi:PD-(D/E)XK nuclease family protein [Leptolyngbya sp. GGD]|uniref:PD-(D/E)XK nuclease family protein n=1 Tax=Leptolyngbya sp. GGD TaxID=2997907 RepID=UPI002279F433|nr:PD-(D/E)XK nuclease family protein [Leptolyngbya sp. GGD]MCY6493408.1 PD-(D/E)XK nuclease family protein [Leptolyngbya sp. GGD]
MELEVKRPDHIVPSYSMTGDLLSYLRCRLQYRYHNGSALPPSRPVQQWFGEFLHGTLELAFRFWQDNHADYPFPWPCTKREWRSDPPNWEPNDIGNFANTVEAALQQQGKEARSEDARDSGYRRVAMAVNLLGPHLFPLIASAERKVIGTRAVPPSTVPLRCSNYEVHGVIDVLTHVTLGEAPDTNLIREYVRDACLGISGQYEVIVDYKGSKRPNLSEPYWEQGDWQVQTYAWLRSRQPDALPVAAGILIYINELTPGDREMQSLKRGIANFDTDVLPEPDSADAQLVRMWRPGNSTEQLSLEFRLRRAIRVIEISEHSTQEALSSFDDVVRRAEEDVVQEAYVGGILQAWFPQCDDEDTCAACDFRYFCPRPAGKAAGYQPDTPSAP